MGFFEQTDNPYGAYLQGKFLYLDGNFARSANLLESSTEAAPDNLSVAYTALVPLLLSGAQAKAVTLAKKLKNTHQEDDLVRLIYLTDLIAHKKYKDALDYIDKTPISRDAFSLVIPLIKAWLQLGLDQEPNITEIITERDQNSTPEIYDFHLGNLYRHMKQQDKAKEHYLKIFRTPQNISFRMAEIMGDFFKSMHDQDNVKKTLLALKISQDDPFIYRHYEQLIQHQKISQPINSIAKAISEIYLQFSATLLDTSFVDLGFAFLRLTSFLNPDHALLQALITNTLIRRELYAEAKSNIDKADQNSPYQHFFQLKEIDLALMDNNIEHALELIENHLKQTPDWEALYLKKAQILTDQRQYEQAINTINQGLKIADISTHPSFYFTLGAAYERLNVWESAEINLKKSLTLKPDQPLVLNYLGYSLVEKNIDVNQGKSYIEKAVSLDPHNAAYLDSLGWAEFRLGQYEKAKNTLEQALTLEPDDPDAHHHLGDVYAHIGRLTEAKFQWKKALSFETDPVKRTKIEEKLKH